MVAQCGRSRPFLTRSDYTRYCSVILLAWLAKASKNEMYVKLYLLCASTKKKVQIKTKLLLDLDFLVNHDKPLV